MQNVTPEMLKMASQQLGQMTPEQIEKIKQMVNKIYFLIFYRHHLWVNNLVKLHLSNLHVSNNHHHPSHPKELPLILILKKLQNLKIKLINSIQINNMSKLAKSTMKVSIL